VVFPADWLDALWKQMVLINDPNFGVLGTFGVDMRYQYMGNVRDPHNNPKLGNLPCEAMTVDEHCFIVRKQSNLSFDPVISGFHFYAADLCMEAMTRGMKNYVIDAPVIHLSPGKVDHSFEASKKQFADKWAVRSPLDSIKTSCVTVILRPPSATIESQGREDVLETLS
jgi:hypothetical protein